MDKLITLPLAHACGGNYGMQCNAMYSSSPLYTLGIINTGQALIEGSTLSIPLSSYWRQLAAIINLIEKVMACASVSDMGEDSGMLSSMAD